MLDDDLIPQEGMTSINPLKSTVESISKQVGDFLGKIIGPPAEALGGLLSDQMKNFRAANLERIARKWMKIREVRGISEAAIKVLPFGDAYRTVEAASIEENENVQELWAQLIASATDDSRSVKIKKVFIDLLKSLGSIDAIMLDVLFDLNSNVPVMAIYKESESIQQEFVNRTIKKVEHLNSMEILSSVQNLLRLRIISLVIPYRQVFGEMDDKTTINDHVRKFDSDQTADALIQLYEQLNNVSGWNVSESVYEMSSSDVALHVAQSYTLTQLGFDLLNACSENPR